MEVLLNGDSANVGDLETKYIASLKYPESIIEIFMNACLWILNAHEFKRPCPNIAMTCFVHTIF
jgi:hypothetical protein